MVAKPKCWTHGHRPTDRDGLISRMCFLNRGRWAEHCGCLYKLSTFCCCGNKNKLNVAATSRRCLHSNTVSGFGLDRQCLSLTSLVPLWLPVRPISPAPNNFCAFHTACSKQKSLYDTSSDCHIEVVNISASLSGCSGFDPQPSYLAIR